MHGDVKQKHILISGATSKLGHAFALAYAKLGHIPVLLSKNEAKIKQLVSEVKQHDIEPIYFITNLSEENSPEQVFEYLEQKRITIHTLINAANTGFHGDFITSSLKQQQQIVNININATVSLTRLALEHMNKLNEGFILNVSSIAAFQPGPYMSVYFAAKAFVLSFTEALRNELEGSGINVSCLCPGPIKSERDKNKDSKRSLLALKPIDAAKIVEFSIKNLNKNKSIIIPGKVNKLLTFGHKILPRTIVTKLSGFLVEDE